METKIPLKLSASCIENCLRIKATDDKLIKSESNQILVDAINFVENVKIMQLNELLKNEGHYIPRLEDIQEDIRKNLEELKLRIMKSDFQIPEIILNKPVKKQGMWIQEKPIFIAQRKHNNPIRRDDFPKRIRGSFCYICGIKSLGMLKCASPCCFTHFHYECAKSTNIGGYTFESMRRNSKLYCSLHHCTACFADHNRTRCFNGKLFACDQCELAWHEDCIPGGCEIDEKGKIICPRHVIFDDATNLHLQHCADCQQGPLQGEKLVKCTKCFRSMHFKCYSRPKRDYVMDTIEEREIATCHWCDMFDFVRYNEYAMARFSRQKWYPCQIIKNDEFPIKSPQLGAVGYLCVKWLPYRGKIYYNIISHNRVITMTHSDYFYITEASKSDIFAEWTSAQEFMLKNSLTQRPLKTDQIPDKLFSNGEKIVKQLNQNKYSKPELKMPRDRLFGRDNCKCASDAVDRCGPSSKCINRALCMECPRDCNELPNKPCSNRRISQGKNCIQVKIEYFQGKGYGAISMEDIPAGGFVGEYTGEVIDEEEKRRRIDRIASLQSNEAQYYIMELDDKRSIDAQYYGNDMRYVNHSCNPNCIIQQFQSDFDLHLVLIAKRNISRGEELSFDYNMQRQGLWSEVPSCHCGEINCTGILAADPATRRRWGDLDSSSSRATKNSKSHRSLSVPSNENSVQDVPLLAKSTGYKRKKLEDTTNNKLNLKKAKVSNI
uniref:Histone-lysine N-methyltransferase n=1 Tax=Meloidogyne incognita TaxID=6306 RepID=A0A914MAC9_MELIC